jgi:amino acid transporter
MRNAGRTTGKALALGSAVVTATYLLINLAYLEVLGIASLRNNTTAGADLVSHLLGPAAGQVMAGVVVIAALSTINATIMTGARTNYALGRDFLFMKPLGRWNVYRNAPSVALLVQGAIAVALIAIGAISERSTIQTMVDYTAPIFWLFLLLVGVSLFVFRWRGEGGEVTFRVPLYPIVPILFIAVCALMIYSSLLSFGLGVLLGLGVLVSGVPVLLAGYFLTRRQNQGLQ